MTMNVCKMARILLRTNIYDEVSRLVCCFKGQLHLLAFLRPGEKRLDLKRKTSKISKLEHLKSSANQFFWPHFNNALIALVCQSVVHTRTLRKTIAEVIRVEWSQLLLVGWYPLVLTADPETHSYAFLGVSLICFKTV